VDSFVPREVALERFQRDSERADSLSGGARSRDALVRAFVRAIETRDTVALRELVITRGEFAHLYYPTSAQGLPPYSLNPDLMWFMLVERSNVGISRALREYGSSPLHYADYRCLGDSTREGENTLWGPCILRRVQVPADTVEQRFFGPVLERGGRYKFLSYANKL
jgi:hypothetical protein